MHDDKYREEQKEEMVKLLCLGTVVLIIISILYFAGVGIIHSIRPT